MSANTKKITNKQKENVKTYTLSDASAVKAQEKESDLSTVPKLSSENEHSVPNSSSENEQSRQSHSFMEMFASSFAKPISHKNVAANKDNKNSNNNDEMEVCETLQTELDALHKELMNIVKEKDELLAIHDARQGVHYVNQEENENNELAHLMQLHKENEETLLRDEYELQENVSRHIAHSKSKVPENNNVDRNTISQFINKTPLNFENNSANNDTKPLIHKSINYNEKELDISTAQRKYIVPTANEILHDAATHVHSLTTNSFVVLRSSILINYSLPNAFTLTLTPSQANELVEIARARRSLSFLEEEEDENKDNINKQQLEEEKLKVNEGEEQLEANRLQNMNAELQNKIKCLQTELTDAKNTIAKLDLLLNTNKNQVINVKEADENNSPTEDRLFSEARKGEAESRNVNNKNFVVNDNIENSNKNNKGNLESMKQLQTDEVSTPKLSENINDTTVANENSKNAYIEQQKPFASLTTKLSEWHTPTSLYPNNFEKICSVDNKNNNNIILTSPIPFKSSPELEEERQQRDHTSILTEESKENTIDETTGEQIPALSSTEIVEPQKSQIHIKTSKTEENSQPEKKYQMQEKTTI